MLFRSQLATQLRAARQEILLANMVWDSGDGAPGARLAGALADLRRHVQAHPHDYPQGMTVRILLGNSVRFDSLLDPTTNAFNAARDLLAAGLPLAGPPEGGWRLELANYRYAAPHSHTGRLTAWAVSSAQTAAVGGTQGSQRPGGLSIFRLGTRNGRGILTQRMSGRSRHPLGSGPSGAS